MSVVTLFAFEQTSHWLDATAIRPRGCEESQSEEMIDPFPTQIKTP